VRFALGFLVGALVLAGAAAAAGLIFDLRVEKQMTTGVRLLHLIIGETRVKAVHQAVGVLR
jgi:hypothetical protein